ncbi:MAG: ATP synthase F0 subunit B [Cyanobacteria bacterium RUI128]|nr:ATP synthase F0 subunit B [Cyanobacteria bacterium RUI128]
MLEFNATFFVAMFSFIIFMIIMNAVLYKPLARIQKERADIIQNDNEVTRITEEKTENLKQQQQANLEQSRIIAKNNFNRKVSEYKERREIILSTAKNLAKKDLAVANAELEGDEREANLLLKSQLNNLASAVASKVLGYETKVED